ncbi:MAG: sugar ABC transporter ATP-binding protein [Sedimentisphaerales bacterium]|nr:sugar ABC transporter ATP-binding protein [Sedimentisphaerales bacterium]
MTQTQNDNIVLKATGISKTFGGIKALDGVNLEIHAGKVNAIVGENGAGKSTLMKILAGIYQGYEGRIFLDGQPADFANPKEAQDNGIAIIHQELNLIPYLSVAENVFLGREFINRFGLISYRRMHRETKKLLDRLDLHISPRAKVSELRIGQQQIVEIAHVLSLNARIVIMDEPTSAISEHEIEVLFDLIRSLKAQGVAIVYITHKLDELFQIADTVTVLRDGKYVGSGLVEELSHDDIVRMMVGRNIKDFFVKSDTVKSGEVLSVRDLCLAHPERPGDYIVKHVDFKVQAGEVLGMFGLMGAGRTELLETIFGLHPKASSGSIFINGQSARINSPNDAIDSGIGFITEDRKQEGLVLQMSVASSISLASLKQTERFGFLSDRLETRLARGYVDRLKIKTPSIRQIVENLSGGNQQKVVIAKWLATDPRILLLDEPTRGIDINAKNEIYRLISELAQKGLAIVMVSSELPEIMAIADRIIVLSEGKRTAEFARSQFTEEAIVKAAIPKSLKLQTLQKTKDQKCSN